jgi:hypothetical protein
MRAKTIVRFSVNKLRLSESRIPDLYLKTVSAELQSKIKNLTKTKSHMCIDVTS